MPGRARARRGSCDASRVCCAVLCGRARPGACRAPTGSRVAYGHVRPADGRQRPSEVYGRAPIDQVHGAGRPSWADVACVHLVNALPLEVCKVFQLLGQLLRRQLLEHVAISEI
jgi:hypothetical protein